MELVGWLGQVRLGQVRLGQVRFVGWLVGWLVGWSVGRSVVHSIIECIKCFFVVDFFSPATQYTIYNISCRLYFFGGFGPVPEFGAPFQHLIDITTEPSGWPRGWNNQLVAYNPVSDSWEWPRARGPTPAPRAAHAADISGHKVGHMCVLWALPQIYRCWPVPLIALPQIYPCWPVPFAAAATETEICPFCMTCLSINTVDVFARVTVSSDSGLQDRCALQHLTVLKYSFYQMA